MFKKDTIKSSIIGVITAFVLLVILDLFGVTTTISRSSISVIIILIIYFIIQSQKKNNKS